GLGEGGAALALGGARQAGGLGLGLGLGDLARLVGLGGLHHGVALGVGRLAHLGVELALGQLGAPGGDLLLGDDDLLVLGGLGHRARRGGVGRGGVGLRLDLGLLERQLAVGHRDLLLGADACLLGLAARRRLGDRGLHLGAGGLGTAEVGQVGALGLDVL